MNTTPFTGNIAFKRGSAAKNDTHTGAARTLTYDKDNHGFRVHDEVTPGGKLVKASAEALIIFDPAVTGNLGNVNGNATVSLSCLARSAYAGATISYTVTAGALPSGLSVSPAGVISGTAPNVTTSTHYAFTIQANDGVNVVSKDFTLNVISTITVAPVGDVVFDTAGTHQWVCPPGVLSVCVVAVGPGGRNGNVSGGGGGGLGWKNDIPVVPGQSYTITLIDPSADGGSAGSTTITIGGVEYSVSGGWLNGSVSGNGTVGQGGHAAISPSGNWQGGGNGGNASDLYNRAGGGGAGGYTGNGGAGGYHDGGTNAMGGLMVTGASSGGGGGGSIGYGGGGGGVTLYGAGTDGVGGATGLYTAAGGDGGGFGAGATPHSSGANSSDTAGGYGGTYGGGAGRGSNDFGKGALRIIWGTGRSFPNNAQNQAPVWVTTAGSLGTMTAPTISAQLSATDPDSSTLTFSLVSGTLPPNVIVSTNGTISGINPMNGLTYNFTIGVSDGVSVVNRAFSMVCSSPINEVFYDVPGTYQWTCPAGVTSVSVAGVGGGGGGAGSNVNYGGSGGGGGSLGWKNNITVVPGQTYAVVVGRGGTGGASGLGTGSQGGDCSFNAILLGKGGYPGFGGSAGPGNGAAAVPGLDGGYPGGNGGNNGAGYTSFGSGGGAGTFSGGGGYGDTGPSAVGGISGGSGGASSQAGGGGGGIYLYGLPNTGANGQSGQTNQYGGKGGNYGGGGGGAWPGSTIGGAGGDGCIRIIWGANRNFPNNAGKILTLIGESVYTSPGNYNWVCPAGVTSVCAVAVGGGASGASEAAQNSSGGPGGGIGWKNNITVVPGQTYKVLVGSGGTSVTDNVSDGHPGDNSVFGPSTMAVITDAYVYGGGGGHIDGHTGGDYRGDQGGNGGGGQNYGYGYGNNSGQASNQGGHGAGGYTGTGGIGGSFTYTNRSGTAGAGGGGGGGSIAQLTSGSASAGCGGGGVGLYGQGANGAAGIQGKGGGGGSGGTDGVALGIVNDTHDGTAGGLYGGGGGAAIASGPGISGPGGSGAVRIIWGPNRSFPNAAA